MIEVYGKPNCSYCVQAVGLLEAKGIGYNYTDVSESDEALELLVSSGLKTLPQCYENGKHIGGFTQLQEYITHQR